MKRILYVLIILFIPHSYAANSIGIRDYDYVEWYVGSAKSVAFWHAKAMGFKITGYAGPETGVRDRVSYYLTKNNLKFVITSALQPECNDICDFIKRHGDGIKRFAYEVGDVKKCYQYVVAHGGIPVRKPHKIQDHLGYVEEASIKIYDDTEIVLISRDNYRGIFKPGFQKPIYLQNVTSKETNLKRVDHIVGNVRINEMRKWADYLNEAFDFQTFIDFGPGDI